MHSTDLQEKFKSLTTRQTIDARTAALRFGNQLMTRMACFALGLDVDPSTGQKIEPMDAKQLKAAEIVLRKILPDLSAVQETKPDDFENMSRDEMVELLCMVVAEYPQLANNPVIQKAVNSAQTVIPIEAAKKE